MSRMPQGAGEFGFVEALMKRGFINIPRMLFDYMSRLDLDYNHVGKLFVVLACVGGPAESAFGVYRVTRKAIPQDFDQVRSLVLQLQDPMVTRCDEVSDNEIVFSFAPLYTRLQAVWEEKWLAYEKEQGKSGPHPAVSLAERLLGRPLSDRDVAEILGWVEEYGFSLEMVEAVIREGQRLGVTHMRYLQAIAKGWFEAGIQTPEQAEAYAQEHQKSTAQYRKVSLALGLNRPLTAPEQAMLDRWLNEWGFHEDVILQACERAAGSKNPLQYTNKVLQAWLAEGVRTPGDLEELLEQRRRTAAAGADLPRGGRSTRRAPAKSNVILKREEKDGGRYDNVFRRFDD